MGGIEMWSVTISEVESLADDLKMFVVGAMVRDGLLEKEVADEWAKEHTIIVRKKNIFRTITNLWEKAEEAKGYYFLVVSIT
jgi:hypothetical protein